jgi:phosphoadenosine phosphosulfate reductase
VRGVSETDLALRARVESLSASLEAATPAARLEAALALFGDGLVFTSSFGAGSAVLLHLWSRVANGRPVVFIDTGFLFPETHAYKNAMMRILDLEVEVVRPRVPREAFLAEWGDDVYERHPDFCCHENKVQPVEPVLEGARGWVSGLRRDQGPTRAKTPIFAWQDDGPVMVHPIATMTADDARAYMAEHALPEHPLAAHGFRSIGCAPCTRATTVGEDERAGRWAWSTKKECGLHARGEVIVPVNRVRRRAA